MKKNFKYSFAAGIVLFVLAALFSISLLLVAIDFGGLNPAKNSFFYSLGKMFTGVYGLSSVCIPIFLIVAGIQCFMSKWRLRNGVLLLGSIIPFFTLDAIEHICRMIVAADSDSVMIVKLASTLLIGSLVLAAEYLLLSILGDVLENSFSENREFNEEIPESAYEEEERFFEDDSSDAESGDEEFVPEENKLDFSNDKIFLQQKELLKDLINDGKPAEESTLSDDPTIIEHEESDALVPEAVSEDELLEDDDFAEPIVPKEPSPFDHIFDEQEKSHEEELKAPVEEETLVEESAPVEEKPVVESEPVAEEKTLIEDATLVDEAEELPVEEEFSPVSEVPVLETEEPAEENYEELFAEEEPLADLESDAEEETADYEMLEPPVLPDEVEPSVEESEFTPIDEEEIPFNSEDFQNEYDEMNDVQPVSIEDFSEIDDEPNFEPIENDEPQSENEVAYSKIDENPAEYINIEDIAEEPQTDNASESATTGTSLGVEDIFSQMEADAAANPVIKGQETPVAKDSLYQPATEPADESELEIEMNEDFEEDEPVDFEDNETAFADYEFNPTAKPVVDANGNPYESSEDENTVAEGFDETAEFEEADEVDEDEILNQIDEIDDIDFDDEIDAPDVVSAEEVEKANQAQEESKVETAIEETKPNYRKLADYKIPSDLLEKFENDEYWRIDDETKAA